MLPYGFKFFQLENYESSLDRKKYLFFKLPNIHYIMTYLFLIFCV